MDRTDPNAWTAEYAKSHTKECLHFLVETNKLVVRMLDKDQNAGAVAGLDRVLNGLCTLQNARCGNFRPHITLLSMASAQILCFSEILVDGQSMSEEKRRSTATELFRDARDFAGNEGLRASLEAVIQALEAGIPFDELQKRLEVDFPADIMNDIRSINQRLLERSKKIQGSSGGCYVATAVYGSYDCPQVWTLRRFRDDTLAESLPGRAFIRLYYALSPMLVRLWGNCVWFQKLWRPLLDRLVQQLNRKGVADTPYQDRPWQ